MVSSGRVVGAGQCGQALLAKVALVWAWAGSAAASRSVMARDGVVVLIGGGGGSCRDRAGYEHVADRQAALFGVDGVGGGQGE